MTERLYYTDAYLAAFDANVVATSDDRMRVYLDATAFYPTSGGQPHDVGTLGGVAVVDVVDETDRIAHVLAQPLGPSSSLAARVDWKRRFDHMQQHTGQHLLSAVFEDLFGQKTLSVHFGPDYATLDLDTDAVSREQLVAAERRANDVVLENRPVTIAFEDAATASELRKASDRAGSIRIVTIEGIDRSACGGTHVRSTGNRPSPGSFDRESADGLTRGVSLRRSRSHAGPPRLRDALGHCRVAVGVGGRSRDARWRAGRAVEGRRKCAATPGEGDGRVPRPRVV